MPECCEKAIIRSGYVPLSRRLLEYGEESYSDSTLTQNVVMWVFSFFDEDSMCRKCRMAFGEMFDWFDRYGLFKDPVRGVRMVIEPQASQNLIYADLGMEKLPANIFCDAEGRIIDIIFEFPEARWLEEHILPVIQNEGRIA